MGIWGRVAGYALLAAMGGALQFGAFDCSAVPLASFLAGFATIFGACLTIESVYRLSRLPGRSGVRIMQSVGAALLGVALVGALGWLTIATHLCG